METSATTRAGAAAAAARSPIQPSELDSKASSSSTRGADCWSQLGTLTQRLVDVVEKMLQTDELMNAGGKKILKSLRELLERASDLIAVASRSKLYRALMADRIGDDFNDVCMRLGICLNRLHTLLSSKQIGGIEETMNDVMMLEKSFSQTVFPLDPGDKKLCMELHKTTADIYEKKTCMRNGSVALRVAILSAFNEDKIKEDWPGTSRQLFQDMNDAREKKDHIEEHYIRHILMAMDILQNTQALKNQHRSAWREGTPPEFYCPISLRIMKEPVVLFQTAVTYDRKSIEGWLKGCGDGTCPVSRRKLESHSYVENKALKSVIEEWVRNHERKRSRSSSFVSVESSCFPNTSPLKEGSLEKPKNDDTLDCFVHLDMGWSFSMDAEVPKYEEVHDEDLFKAHPLLWDLDAEYDCEDAELTEGSDGAWGVIDDLFA